MPFVRNSKKLVNWPLVTTRNNHQQQHTKREMLVVWLEPVSVLRRFTVRTAAGWMPIPKQTAVRQRPLGTKYFRYKNNNTKRLQRQEHVVFLCVCTKSRPPFFMLSRTPILDSNTSKDIHLPQHARRRDFLCNIPNRSPTGLLRLTRNKSCPFPIYFSSSQNSCEIIQ